jgi:hypothetical protein
VKKHYWVGQERIPYLGLLLYWSPVLVRVDFFVSSVLLLDVKG